MLQIKLRPYNLLLLTGIVLLLTSFFVLKRDSAVDIHFHDTYYIIAHAHFFCLLGIISLFIWTLYLATKKMLYSKALTWTHVILTVLSVASVILILSFASNHFDATPQRYYDYNSWDLFKASQKYNTAIAIVIVILLIGQVVFIVNIIAGLFKRKTFKKHI
jgi:cytochrome c oxidase subunit 1